MIYGRWYARAYASADNYHTRKTPTVALSLTVIEVAKFCVAKNKRDIRFLYFCRTRRFAHIGLRSDMRGKVTNIIRDYLHFPPKKTQGGTHSLSSEEIKHPGIVTKRSPEAELRIGLPNRSTGYPGHSDSPYFHRNLKAQNLLQNFGFARFSAHEYGRSYCKPADSLCQTERAASHNRR